jgi:GxxExxY protein
MNFLLSSLRGFAQRLCGSSESLRAGVVRTAVGIYCDLSDVMHCGFARPARKPGLEPQSRRERHAEGRGDVMNINELTEKIIGCAIEVHRHVGPGLLESAYEQCLCHEFALNGISFQRQVPYPMKYKGVSIDIGYRIDVLVEDVVILELKSISGIDGIHKKQLLTYLRAADKPVGLVLNFNVKFMKNGICRVVNKLNENGLEVYTDFARNSRSDFEDIIDEQFEDVRYLLAKK